jgi:hypothetical protein
MGGELLRIAHLREQPARLDLGEVEIRRRPASFDGAPEEY